MNPSDASYYIGPVVNYFRVKLRGTLPLQPVEEGYYGMPLNLDISLF